MFVISKRNFLIQVDGQEPFHLKKDYIGDIPDYIASHWLIQAALEDGSIAASTDGKDKSLRSADEQAKEKESKADIRPDAQEAAAKGKK